MISIIVPAYNEELGIEHFILEMKKRIKLKEDYELVIINDGSTDKTAEIVSRLMKGYPSLRLVTYEKNKGLGGAIRTGIQEAKGRAIIEMDSDLTQPPEVIPSMLKALDGADVVYASRYVRGGGMKNVPRWRVWLSIAANNLFRLIYWLPIKDATSGFRAYKSSTIKKINIERTGFAVQLEISVKLAKIGARFREVPFVLINRQIGESKFSFKKMIARYVRNIIELFFYRWF
ncbi:MAG: polyprenol monophosphomannose synthase [Nanoarchaeota archaeon]